MIWCVVMVFSLVVSAAAVRSWWNACVVAETAVVACRAVAQELAAESVLLWAVMRLRQQSDLRHQLYVMGSVTLYGVIPVADGADARFRVVARWDRLKGVVVCEYAGVLCGRGLREFSRDQVAR